MIEIERTYENFRGETVTKKLYFHMSLKELQKMQSINDPDVQEAVSKADEKDVDKVINELAAKKTPEESLQAMEDLILGAYGYISDDGEEFVKDEKFTDAFARSTAYEEFLIDIMTEDGYLDTFIAGVVPKKMQPNVTKMLLRLKDKAKDAATTA